MRKGRFGVPARLLVAAAVVSLALVSTSVIAPATAAGSCTAGQLPAVYPEDQLQIGQMATGMTTIQGRTPQSFHAEILGVIPDAILPGKDVILVKLSGGPMNQTGGAFYGMSGSPISIGGQLVGALAYGPPDGYGDQTIAGVTPAKQMLDVLNYSSSSTTSSAPAATIRLSTAQRETAARAAGDATADVPPQLEALKTPLGISGVSDRVFKRMQKRLNRLGLQVVLFHAAAATSPTAVSPQPLAPGAPVAAVVSYGDMTSAGIGTLTAICGNEDLMFGHPFFWDGKTTMGMNGADVLTVVKDPSALIGPYMVANVDEAHGTIDQDRISALRGIDGELPPVAAVTAHVRNSETGVTRDGETDIVKQKTGLDSMFAFLAPFSIVGEQDSAFDEIGGGTDRVAWTLHGTTTKGEHWSVSRANISWDPYDASFTGIFDLLNALYVISENRFVGVRFTSLQADSTITTRQLTEKIARVRWSSPEHPVFTTNQRIVVLPGQTLRLRVQLVPFGSTHPQTKKISLKVPATFGGGGELLLRGGFAEEGFYGSLGAKSFDGLLKKIRGHEHDNDLVVQLFGRGVRPAQGKHTFTQTRDVFGRKAFFVGFGGSPGGLLPPGP